MVVLGCAASAQTLDDLKNDGKNPDNVLTYGMGYSLNRYSPLKQIEPRWLFPKRTGWIAPAPSASLSPNWLKISRQTGRRM